MTKRKRFRVEMQPLGGGGHIETWCGLANDTSDAKSKALALIARRGGGGVCVRSVVELGAP